MLNNDKLPEGLHESLVTERLNSAIAAELTKQTELGRVDDADSPHVLTQHIAAAIHQRLAAAKDPEDRLAIANQLLHAVEDPRDPVLGPLQQLRAVRPPAGPGQVLRLQNRPKTQ